MKRFKKMVSMFLTALIFSTLIAPQAIAAEVPMSAEMRIEELRKQDVGPDLSKGRLVEEFWGTEEDGTPYVERTYIENTAGNVSIAALNGSARYTKTKSYGATGSVEVSATFTWNTSAKTVYVSDVEGDIVNPAGISEITDKTTSTSGNGTSKATAKFSCRVNKNLGGWSTYSVSLSCDYNGNDS